MLLCRAPRRGQLESTIKGREPLGDEVELLIRQWLQQLAHRLLGQRRPLNDMATPLRSDVKPDQAAVVGIAFFANDPLIGQIAHEYRHPALVQPRQPRDLVDSDAGTLGYLLEQDKTRTGQPKRQPVILGQLQILPTKPSLHAAQQSEDVLLSLRATRRPSASFSRAVRFERNVHA